MSALHPEYEKIVECLTPLLGARAYSLITIDGKCGSGKSNLAAFLGYRFRISVVELDLFWLIENGIRIGFYDDQIKRIIEFRRNLNRPVIIEGFQIEELIDRLKLLPSFRVYIRNSLFAQAKSPKYQESLYETKYAPVEKA